MTTATRTSQICIFYDEKKKKDLQHDLHVQFAFLYILQTFSFFPRREMTPVLQLCARREHMMTKAQFFLLISEALLQFNSRIVTTHLASVMTLNNREMITGTRSYIFR